MSDSAGQLNILRKHDGEEGFISLGLSCCESHVALSLTELHLKAKFKVISAGVEMMKRECLVIKSNLSGKGFTLSSA